MQERLIMRLVICVGLSGSCQAFVYAGDEKFVASSPTCPTVFSLSDGLA